MVLINAIIKKAQKALCTNKKYMAFINLQLIHILVPIISFTVLHIKIKK